MTRKIDTFKETILGIDGASKHVAKISGKKRNRQMMLRWANTGVAGVKLSTILIGSEIFTSHEAINEFVNEARAAKQAKRSKNTSAGIRVAKMADVDAEARELGI